MTACLRCSALTSNLVYCDDCKYKLAVEAGMEAIGKVEKSLSAAGVTITEVQYLRKIVKGVFNGESVEVHEREGFCTLFLGDMTIANLLYPHLVGRAVVERRHIGLFE